MTRSNPTVDGLTAALSVVVPMICGRSFTAQEIGYIRARLDGIPSKEIEAALVYLGDTADRVGNPIAAIRRRVQEVRRDRSEHATARRMTEQIEAKSRRAIEDVGKRMAAKWQPPKGTP